MRYIKFKADTPYCGTEHEEYDTFPDGTPDADLDDIAEDIRRNNAESYEYLVSGWDDENFEGMTEEEQQEEIDNYYADCWGGWEEVSQKEYEENA